MSAWADRPAGVEGAASAFSYWVQMDVQKVAYLILLGVILTVSPSAQGKQPTNIYQSVRASVVCLESFSSQGSAHSGSGFFVAPGVIATTSHQVSKATRIVAHLSDGTSQSATLPLAAKGREVALLTVPTTRLPFLSLHTGDPAIGEEVFTMGCPLGLDHSLSQGIISHSRRLIEGRELIQTDLTINEGNSGGPLLNKEGRVVGIIHGYLKGSNGINFAIPIDELSQLMAQVGLNSQLLAIPELYRLWEEAQRTQDPATYGEILKKAPWITEAIYNQGIIYFGQKQFSEAKERFETAIRQRPEYYQAYTNLGLTLYKLGKPAEARDALLEAIIIKTDYAIAYLNLGIVYQRGLSDLRSARHAFLRYLELDPDSSDAAEVQRWLQQIEQSLSS